MYTFRIKAGSKLHNLLDDMLDANSPITTQAEATAKGYDWTVTTVAWSLGRWADNFSVSRSGNKYTDVVPNTIVQSQIVQADQLSAPQQTAQADQGKIESILWPDVPVIGDPNPTFRTPGFYSTMGAMVKAGKHISLEGPPGIGKSTSVEQLAAECHVPLVHVSADAGLRRRHLEGTPEIINGHTVFQVSEYAAAAVFGWWAKVDEVNAAEPDALMYINSQVAPPYMINIHGKAYPVHNNFRLFVTYNAGLVGTKPLPDSFKDRFYPIKLSFPTDLQLRNMLEANGMPDQSVAPWTNMIIRFARLCVELHDQGRIRYQITPRRLMDAVTLVNLGVLSDVTDALEASTVAAVDNQAEQVQLKMALKKAHDEVAAGRL